MGRIVAYYIGRWPPRPAIPARRPAALLKSRDIIYRVPAGTRYIRCPSEAQSSCLPAVARRATPLTAASATVCSLEWAIKQLLYDGGG